MGLAAGAPHFKDWRAAVAAYVVPGGTGSETAGRAAGGAAYD
ncbi:hypothetical protein [Kribbella italica]|uniref:Uncharacterized protein n=1 Tax=Kribbella italica TaxID=1540520 RepID=A0A7W9J0Z0_9ACTN|nr:hypothetical protein [Kribbella italica]MBB5833603.1 hypothetical protein [Kribbella italica]